MSLNIPTKRKLQITLIVLIPNALKKASCVRKIFDATFYSVFIQQNFLLHIKTLHLITLCRTEWKTILNVGKLYLPLVQHYNEHES